MKRLIAVTLLVVSTALLSMGPATASGPVGLAATTAPTDAASSAARRAKVLHGTFDPQHLPPVAQSSSRPADLRARPFTTDVDYLKRADAAKATTPHLDPALALSGSLNPAMASNLGSYEGIDENVITNPYVPSDGAIASNGTQIVYAANQEIQARSTVTGSVLGTWTFSQFFYNAFGAAGPPSGTTFADPHILWDAANGRFLFVVIAVNFSTVDGWTCFAASQSSDGSGLYWIDCIDSTWDNLTQTGNFSDYPLIGSDAQYLYTGLNQFSFSSGTFQYAKLRVIDKNMLESGMWPSWIDLGMAGWQNADGSPVFAPSPAINQSAASGEFIVNSRPLGSSFLTVWYLTNPLTAPTWYRSTVSVAPYYFPATASQPGGVTALDAGDNRLGQVVQRSGRLWTSMTSSANWGYGTVDSVRVFGIDGTNPFLPALTLDDWTGWTSQNAFYSSVGVDGYGNVTVTFLCSGLSLYPSICASSHGATEPSGVMDPSQFVWLPAGRSSGRTANTSPTR
jgi:hypothetical protein